MLHPDFPENHARVVGEDELVEGIEDELGETEGTVRSGCEGGRLQASSNVTIDALFGSLQMPRAFFEKGRKGEGVVANFGGRHLLTLVEGGGGKLSPCCS